MAKIADLDLDALLKIIPDLIKFQATEFTVDYDVEADVLYISLQRPQDATDTETLDNGVLIRYQGDEVIGLTVLNASQQPL